ncbi:MAG TPA: EVE domain-containing protein [Candidatus Acidoferrales bacterium]|nr:EVE domain-containing protein [Candidatus Acidoferrales bacterium]
MTDTPATTAETPPEPAPEKTAERPRSKKRRKGREARAAGCWMIVSSPENLRKTREKGYSIQGIKSRHRRRVEAMRPGDRILYYVTGRMAFAATSTVTSPMYEDHTPIWRSARRDEDYPWRVHIRPDLILDEPDWVLAKELAYRLDYVRKWPPEHWTLAFQGHLHQLPRTDFKLIEDELARTARRRHSVAS